MWISATVNLSSNDTAHAKTHLGFCGLISNPRPRIFTISTFKKTALKCFSFHEEWPECLLLLDMSYKIKAQPKRLFKGAIYPIQTETCLKHSQSESLIPVSEHFLVTMLTSHLRLRMCLFFCISTGRKEQVSLWLNQFPIQTINMLVSSCLFIKMTWS